MTVTSKGVTGSSPRMRGALYRVAANESWFRIIPADAGSTFSLDKKQPLHEDHPRGCGEHRGYKYLKLSTLGSSPRMRGAHSGLPLTLVNVRIIPADAGSTLADAIKKMMDEDHPRGCGEHRLQPSMTAFHVGSSPRMRGALAKSSE